MVGKVLVPLDGSPRAESALPKAIEVLGDRPGATLILVRAVQTIATSDAYLRALAASLEDKAVPRVMTSMWYGITAAEAIVEAAHRHHVDLIVMSSRGPGASHRARHDSVAQSVRRSTDTPMLIVPAGRDATGPRSARAS